MAPCSLHISCPLVIGDAVRRSESIGHLVKKKRQHLNIKDLKPSNMFPFSSTVPSLHAQCGAFFFFLRFTVGGDKKAPKLEAKTL